MLSLSGCADSVVSFPAPLVQRPSTSAFQAGDHGFESRTGYQSVVRVHRFFVDVWMSQRRVDEPHRYRGDCDP